MSCTITKYPVAQNPLIFFPTHACPDWLWSPYWGCGPSPRPSSSSDQKPHAARREAQSHAKPSWHHNRAHVVPLAARCQGSAKRFSAPRVCWPTWSIRQSGGIVLKNDWDNSCKLPQYLVRNKLLVKVSCYYGCDYSQDKPATEIILSLSIR